MKWSTGVRVHSAGERSTKKGAAREVAPFMITLHLVLATGFCSSEVITALADIFAVYKESKGRGFSAPSRGGLENNVKCYVDIPCVLERSKHLCTA